MIDIGVNLTNPQLYSEAEAIVARAQAAGVSALILTGTDLAESQAALALAERWPNYAFTTAGVHPHDAIHWSELAAAELRHLAQNPTVIAIGECGLDFNRDYSPRPQQELAFSAQIELAVELQKPLFLHCRDAHQRFIALLKPWLPQLKGAVLHCFTGSDAELDECLELGLYIGVTGWICDERRGLDLAAQVARIPAERLLIETDAPFLLPRDLRPRPKRNEPAFLPHIAAKIAACRGEPVEQLLASSLAATQTLFQLPSKESL